jgi:valyl-tRNA synthetase
MVTAVRSLRKEYGVGEGARVQLLVESDDPAFRDTVSRLQPQLERLARVEAVEWRGPHEGSVGASAVLQSGPRVFLPLEGVVDLDRERDRLGQEIDHKESLLAAARGKLGNVNFVERAPAEVVAKEREKAASLEDQLQGLRDKLVLFKGGE